MKVNHAIGPIALQYNKLGNLILFHELKGFVGFLVGLDDLWGGGGNVYGFEVGELRKGILFQGAPNIAIGDDATENGGIGAKEGYSAFAPLGNVNKHFLKWGIWRYRWQVRFGNVPYPQGESFSKGARWMGRRKVMGSKVPSLH
jgi:hypothetical protein